EQCQPGIRAGQRGSIARVVRTKTGRAGSGGAADRRDRDRQTSAGGSAGDRKQWPKARSGAVARGDREYDGGEVVAGRLGGARVEARSAVSVRHRWCESVAGRDREGIRGKGRCAALSNPQAAECEGSPTGELPE